jgi:hypothetical protein
MSGFDDQETKLATYWNTPFKEICLGMKVNNSLNFISISYQASSLYDVIADGRNCRLSFYQHWTIEMVIFGARFWFAITLQP